MSNILRPGSVTRIVSTGREGQATHSLGELDAGVCTPKPVDDEVVTHGIDEGYPDARRIESAVEDGPVDAMLEAGWYCSPDLYATIRRRIEALS